MYREAGADMLFVEAPRTRDDLASDGVDVRASSATTPLLANIGEGDLTRQRLKPSALRW